MSCSFLVLLQIKPRKLGYHLKVGIIRQVLELTRIVVCVRVPPVCVGRVAVARWVLAAVGNFLGHLG